MYPAMDLTAGEKERATMETILSSPISRTHLVLGKFLLVLTASWSPPLLSVTSMGVSSWSFNISKTAGARTRACMLIKLDSARCYRYSWWLCPWRCYFPQP